MCEVRYKFIAKQLATIVSILDNNVSQITNFLFKKRKKEFFRELI